MSKQLLTRVTDRTALDPGNNHVIIWRDIHTIEFLPGSVEDRTLRIRADPVYENVPAIPGEHKVVPVKRYVGFAHAADGGVFAERVHDRHGAAGDVISLELVGVNIIERVVILPRPPRFAGRGDLEGKIPNVESGSVIEPVVALVHQNNPGIVTVEGGHGRILVGDPSQVAGAVGVWRTQRIRYPLDR